MTDEQFDALAAVARMGSTPSRRAARQVLVGGASLTRAATSWDLSPQAVWNAVRRIREAQELVGRAGCPKT